MPTTKKPKTRQHVQNSTFTAKDLGILKGKKAVSLGGSHVKSHAKQKRPLAARSTYHVVLRSEKARGALNMLKPLHKARVKSTVYTQAKRFFVKIESFANVGNHLHIKAYAQAPKEFQNFLRTVTALIARKVTGAKKGAKFGRFWSGLAFTRILKSFKEHEILKRYIFANILESETGRASRNDYLAIWYEVPGWRERLRASTV